MLDAATTHDWIAVALPNSDTGWQCQRCQLTAISLPVPKACERCPYDARAWAEAFVNRLLGPAPDA